MPQDAKEAYKEAKRDRRIMELYTKGLKTKDEEDYRKSAECWGKIIKLNSSDDMAYYNWGNALSEMAKKKEGSEAEQFFNQAFEKFAKAVKIKPDDNMAYNNWGLALSGLARKKDGKEAEQLFNQAIEKFAKAVEIKPDDNTAYLNWGLALSGLARKKEGNKAEQLFNQAIEKFAKTVAIKQDDNDVYYNWGGVLLELWKVKGCKDKRLLDEAKEKCLKAEGIKEGTGAYNLACAFALLGDEKNCKKWLGVGEKAGILPTHEHAMSDPDLESVREKDWFKKIKWAGAK